MMGLPQDQEVWDDDHNAVDLSWVATEAEHVPLRARRRAWISTLVHTAAQAHNPSEHALGAARGVRTSTTCSGIQDVQQRYLENSVASVTAGRASASIIPKAQARALPPIPVMTSLDEADTAKMSR